MAIIDWLKEHPYLAGGGALGILILFLLLRGGSSNSGGTTTIAASGPSESLQAAQLSSATQLQEVQAQATAAGNAQSAQVAENAANNAAAIQLAQLKQQTDLQSIVSGGQVQLGVADTQLKAIQAQIGGQVSISQNSDTAQVSIAGIQAGILKDQYDNQAAVQEAITTAQSNQASSLSSAFAALLASFKGGGSTSQPVATPVTSGGFTPIPNTPSNPTSFGRSIVTGLLGR